MRNSSILLLLALMAACGVPAAKNADSQPLRAKTTFQTGGAWSPYVDNRADAVMVYGVNATLGERIASWRDRGYDVDFMTGIAWGGYEEYFSGEWDGVPHWDEAQVAMDGDTLWHNKNAPYIVPTENYLRYFKERIIKTVIDEGIDHIYLEEPEFWARAGYSDSFKREWEAFYGEPWRPQHSSPEATYLSNKLKYHLYYRALDEAFTYAKQYGRSLGREIKCYVPTHSLVNYTQWEIVSPEASLASLESCDGYIAQVWTGTSRVPEYFDGSLRERVFENAYLEYTCAASMTAPTGRRVWLLTDPIEDRSRDWDDFRENYKATYTAQMMLPGIADYEVMPWPDRIYRRPYPVKAGSDETSLIPRPFATMMQVMIGASHEMPVSEAKVSGTQGISVLMGNSLMFQRFPVHDGYEDPQLANFYGLTMPLLKRGIPVGIAHIENLGFPATLSETRVLLMTYSNMKPMKPEAHRFLSEWVRSGGCLIYCATDSDPFQDVSEWWNSGEWSFATPSDHLFEAMGIPAGAGEGVYPFGSGSVTILRQDPKEFVLNRGGDASLIRAVENAAGGLEFKNSLTLERGPYRIIAVMDESVSDEPYVAKGCYIDLFDPALPVLSEKVVIPGTQAFLYDVTKAPEAPCILAAASRAYDISCSKGSFSYVCKGPLDTDNATRILLPSAPVSVSQNGLPAEFTWDPLSRTVFIAFANDPDGVKVEIEY